MAGDVNDAGSGKEVRPSWYVNHHELPVYCRNDDIRQRYPKKHDTQQFLTHERLLTLLYLAYRIMQMIFVMCLLWSYKDALKKLENPYFAVRVLSIVLYRCTQLFITGVVLGDKDARDIFLGMCRMTYRAFKRVCSDK